MALGQPGWLDTENNLLEQESLLNPHFYYLQGVWTEILVVKVVTAKILWYTL